MRSGWFSRASPHAPGNLGKTPGSYPLTTELKAAACRAIDARRDDVVAIGRQIWRAPELGFKEHRTAALAESWLARLGLPCTTGLGLTGVKAVLEGVSPGPTVAILGELDSLLSWEHPDHDPETGAAHACGHNAQIAALIGVALGLVEGGVMAALAGRVAFIAVPAEEFVEIEERLRLRAAGRIELLAGKQELLRLGVFDDVDIAIMVHATAEPRDGRLGVGGTSNGMVAKFVRYVGRAAHAGGAPHRGVNALYAAQVALAGINALRETFLDDDHVRVHPIITRGGDVVSAIPSDVRVETFVRAASVEAIAVAHRKVDRALKAGALALGARLELTTVPGYLPMYQDQRLVELFSRNAELLVGADSVGQVGHRTGGTDMGDLSHILPVLHPFAAGATGTVHGADFTLDDYDAVAITPAKAMASTVVDLLADDAARARQVIAEFRPRFTRAGYLEFVRSLATTETYESAD
ncbi:MAG TPA: amidohydrolase [Chloroflexota bacterium]|nr:amidohydrolase [Chloroflexota bacterium]